VALDVTLISILYGIQKQLQQPPQLQQPKQPQLLNLNAKTKRKRRHAKNGKRRENVPKRRSLNSVKRLAKNADSTFTSQTLVLKRMK